MEPFVLAEQRQHLVQKNSNLAQKAFFFALFLDLILQCCTFLPQKLVSLFNFHNYDNLRHFVKKRDPRRQEGDERVCCTLHPCVRLVCRREKKIKNK